MSHKQTQLERRTQKIHLDLVLYSDCNKVQVVQDGTPIFQINIDLSKKYFPNDETNINYGRYYTKGLCLKLARLWLSEHLATYELSEESR